MQPQYYVIGQPIEHSLSPEIHRLFAVQAKQNIRYDKCCVSPASLGSVMQRFQAEGVRGLSVTAPLKEKMFAYVDRLDPSAVQTGAVNTVLFEPNGEIKGVNTDGVGLIEDITLRLGVTLKGKNILVLGAGGAAAGILPSLCQASPSVVMLYNRTYARVKTLLTRLSLDDVVVGCQKMPTSNIDIIINATASGLTGELPAQINPVTIKGAQLVYDLNYRLHGETVFCQWAKHAGAHTVSDGLGMLCAQAAKQFYCWRGMMPNVEAIMRVLTHEAFVDTKQEQGKSHD